MSFLLNRLYPASYKGAAFYFISDARTEGRRIVVHDYPGQTDDTEDLGYKNKEFSIQGEIHGFFYEDDKKKFELALNSEGSGILLHPFLGSIKCVCTGFTISETTGKVGSAVYNLNFKEVTDKVYPTPATDVTSYLANLYNKFYDFIRDYLKGEYIANFLKNIEAMAQKLRALADFANGIVGAMKGGDNLDKESYFKNSKFIISNSIKISSTDGDIGDNIANLIGSFDIVSLDGQTRFDSSNQLFGFGEDDIYLNDDTAQNNQNINNKKIVNGAINSLALINMYDAARSINFTDQEQLSNIVNSLENNYNNLIDSDKIFLKENLLDELNDMRVQSNKFFNQIKLQLPRIIEIKTNSIPLAVLIYQYYGNTDNYDIILDLNNIYNPSNISGIKKMLSEE